jgi:hypothetical protein
MVQVRADGLRQIMRVKCADSRVEELDFVNDLVNGFHALDWICCG